jgi:hypothetical protein
MNTTHTTFSAGNVSPPYTVVGSAERSGSAGLAAVLLNRSARYPRRQVFTELVKAGFDYIISVENPAGHYEIDELAATFPQARFVLLSARLTPGEQINIAAGELRTPLFFVLWDDLRILYGGHASKIAERLLLSSGELGRGEPHKNWYRRLCTTPVFQNTQLEPLPFAFLPAMHKPRFEALPYTAAKEDAPTLFPFQSVGIYDRQRFFRIGGFDTSIQNPYWQLVDFGFRAWLWGEEIRCTHHIRLRYGGSQTLEDSTCDESYWCFALKNLIPAVRRGEAKTVYAHLPLKKLLFFMFRSGLSPRTAFRHFFAARKWMRAHGENWKMSAEEILAQWDIRS